MGRRVVILTLAALALPAVASASTEKQYILRHPKHEHCKAHYVKKVERVKRKANRKTVKVTETVCVYVKPSGPKPAPTLTPTVTTVYAFSEDNGFHVYVRGTVSAGGMGLVGVPITYTIRDFTTGQPAGSFTGPSDTHEACSIVYTTQGVGGVQTFTGESLYPDFVGCPLAAPISIPPLHLVELIGSFAGRSTYAPSVSGLLPWPVGSNGETESL
jgi:hypothetical protein